MSENSHLLKLASKLRSHEARIDSLTNLLEGIPLGRDDKRKARAMMGELKDSLAGDVRLTERSRDPFVLVFHGEVAQTHAIASDIRRNSVPSEDWQSFLCEASINIGHALHSIEEHLASK